MWSAPRATSFIFVEDGEHYKAATVAEKWYDWLTDIGEVGRLPEHRRVDMDATVSHQQTETDEYVLITDDEMSDTSISQDESS